MFRNLRSYALDASIHTIAHGRLPAGWGERRMGTIGAFTASGIDKKLVDGEPQVRIVNYLDVFRNQSHTLTRRHEYMSVTCPEWKRVAHQVKRGDLIFTPSSETAEEIGRSAVALEDLDNTAYSYHVLRFRPSVRIDADFARFWCNHTAFYDQLAAASIGTTRKILSRGDFRNVLVVVPPHEDQRAIAKYLGHAHARIDRAIAAKRKLIALLEEQKQAIIHQAVTRGLDPTVPLKDSGIPGLGEIPAHWSTVPLKHLARFKSGAGFPVSEQGRAGNAIPFFRVSDMNAPGNGQWLYMTDSSVTPDDARRLGAYVFPEGSIVFPKVGGALLTNKRRRLAQASCVDNNVMAAILPAGEGGDYVNLVLSRVDLGKYVNPGPVPAIGEGQVGRIRVAMPPSSEQRSILELVGTSTSTIVMAQDRARDEIELLREFRTRLTSDVVTGQVDVREIADTLPELTDDMLANTSDDAVDTVLEDVEDFTEGEDD